MGQIDEHDLLLHFVRHYQAEEYMAGMAARGFVADPKYVADAKQNWHELQSMMRDYELQTNWKDLTK